MADTKKLKWGYFAELKFIGAKESDERRVEAEKTMQEVHDLRFKDQFQMYQWFYKIRHESFATIFAGLTIIIIAVKNNDLKLKWEWKYFFGWWQLYPSRSFVGFHCFNVLRHWRLWHATYFPYHLQKAWLQWKRLYSEQRSEEPFTSYIKYKNHEPWQFWRSQKIARMAKYGQRHGTRNGQNYGGNCSH